VDAEWDFINAAKGKSTRDAFLMFLSDSAVTFGAAPRKGKKHLEKQGTDDSWLYWEPDYSDISASGDFGFNTGPWEVRKNRAADEAVAYGQFVTVWKKENGTWKVAIDIGIAHHRPEQKSAWKSSAISLKQLNAPTRSIFQRVVAEEQKFIKEYAAKGVAAYQPCLSTEARVLRHQHHPMGPADISKITSPKAKEYRFMDGEISAMGDLAYVYGQVLVEVQENGTSKMVEGNYMRIWKKEDGKNWKIVVDVLTYL